MPMLPIYIFGALANALVSSINSRKQQALQEKLAGQNQDLQRENIQTQLKNQLQIHAEGYKQQIATQLRSYALTNSWPLDIAPSHIAEMLNGGEHVPLFLVVAPAQQSGIQKELYSMWEELRNFFLNAFPLNSHTPVVHGGYKANYPVSRSQDVVKIFAGIKGIPTLYIAPYSTARDSILGVMVAFWGLGGAEQPAVQNFELDVRKLYVDEIRKEACDYKERCDDGRLIWDEKSAMAANWSVFDQEKRLLERKNDFKYLDQRMNFYQAIRPSKDTYISIGDQILPIIQLFSSAIVDTYFVLEYGTKPLFPCLAQRIIGEKQLPELLSRGMTSPSDEFGTITGIDFANGLRESYARIIVDNADVSVCRQAINEFEKLGLVNCRMIEEKLQARETVKAGESVSPTSTIGMSSEDRNVALQDLIAKATQHNDPMAQFQVAVYWLKKKDYAESLKWANCAAENGSTEGATLRDELTRVLHQNGIVATL